jgi:hypothetical protein
MRAVVSLILLLACASAAYGEPESRTAAEVQSEDWIARGIALRRTGDDAGALTLFERAYALDPSSRAEAQIALAHQALGHWLEAESRLAAVLNYHDDPWVEEHRAVLLESLAAVEQQLGWLVIESEPTGAEIWLDGEPRGVTPLATPLHVTAGEHQVDLRRARVTIHRPIQVEAASRTYLSVAFAPMPQAASATAAPPPQAEPPRSHFDPRTAAWIALGGSSALLIAGTVGQIVREHQASIYNDDSVCAPQGSESRYDRCGSHRDLANTAQTLAIAGFVGAGLAAVASVAMFASGSPKTDKEPRQAARCVLGIGALLCEGRF